MTQADDPDTTVYEVVINQEEQYSIWPAHREVPVGWRAVGKHGLKPECLGYINETWTDLKPRSLREQMKSADDQQ